MLKMLVKFLMWQKLSLTSSIIPESFAEDLAIHATTTVGVDLDQRLREVDVKKYIKVKKVPEGQLQDSEVLKGVPINKDAIFRGMMRGKIINLQYYYS